jgi:hypothetical protein
MDSLTYKVGLRYLSAQHNLEALRANWTELQNLNLDYPVELLKEVNGFWKSRRVKQALDRLEKYNIRLAVFKRTFTPLIERVCRGEADIEELTKRPFTKELDFWINGDCNVFLEEIDMQDSYIFAMTPKLERKWDVLDKKVIAPLWDYMGSPSSTTRVKAIKGLEVLSHIDYSEARQLENEVDSRYPGWLHPDDANGVKHGQEWIAELLTVRPILESGDIDEKGVAQLRHLLENWEDEVPHWPDDLTDFYSDTTLGQKVTVEFESKPTISQVSKVIVSISKILE